MAKRVRSLDPIIDENSRVLILGTMPGPESLRRKQYYANPRNQFWKVIYRVLDESKEPSSDYKERINFLKKNGIALWDVLKSCEREGASDSKIRNGKPNNFGSLPRDCPGLRIFFNGKTAECFFKKCGCSEFAMVQPERLPSTSSANTRLTIDEKTRCWRVISGFL
jgi:methylated-DNA-[protein]-cysteine S-methyltransferase